LNPKKIDFNSNTQADFTLESFYRREFGQVLDTLINLMAENLKFCLSSVQPIYHILSVPLKSTITLEDIKKAFCLFPPGSDLSKVTDFVGILCEINILRLNTDNGYNNTLKSIMESSNKLKTVIPSANAFMSLSIYITSLYSDQ
jgi:hypothetical protein